MMGNELVLIGIKIGPLVFKISCSHYISVADERTNRRTDGRTDEYQVQNIMPPLTEAYRVPSLPDSEKCMFLRSFSRH